MVRRQFVRVVCLVLILSLASSFIQTHMLGRSRSAQLHSVPLRNTVFEASRRWSRVVSRTLGDRIVELTNNTFGNTTSSSGYDYRHYKASSVHYFGVEHALVNTMLLYFSLPLVVIFVVIFGYYLWVRFFRNTTQADVWEDVAMTDEQLGDAQTTRPASQHHADMLDIINSDSWRDSLVNFLAMISVDPLWINHVRSRYERRNARRHVDQLLLKHRDIIFSVRNNVFTKVSKEAMAAHTEANRLIVARHVEETFVSMNISDQTRHRIREACVNACFINTIYDVAGKAILLGPPRRRV